MTPISAAPRGKRYKLRIARVGCENMILLQTEGFGAVTPFVHLTRLKARDLISRSQPCAGRTS